jgi:uncharacterized protein YndB with AHSA1/START domain
MVANKITVETVVNAPIDKTWDYFVDPDHIRHWYHASDDWYTPTASNDPVEGGSFSYRLEAKDGSQGFDFDGMYDEIMPGERIVYTLGDGRQVIIVFTPEGETTRVTETFETEDENPIEKQREGWQRILDNFKTYVEER